MAGVIHIAEVAAILTVAYALGWGIGYLARRLYASRPVAVVPAIPAERIAAVTAAADPDALVKAPVIVPVTSEPPSAPPAPSAPAATEAVPAPPEPFAIVTEPEVVAPVPEPEVAVGPTAIEPELPAVAPAAVEEPKPAVEAAPIAELPAAKPAPVATKLPPMEIPAFEVPVPLRVEPIRSRREPEPVPAPEPEPDPEPVVPFTATPALRPGMAWSGEIRGRSATAVLAPVPEPAPETPPEVFDEPPIDVPVTLELTETIPFVAEPDYIDVAIGVLEPGSTPDTPTISLEDEIASKFAQAVRDPAPVRPGSTRRPEPAVSHDEDAAMRAIEGGWSRVKTRALTDAPEMSDVGAAVAAAQTAVEQVLAQAGIDEEDSERASKPEGLVRPRGGRKDDLTNIAGLGALDESTLNNLGVYHFDQIAGWSDAQVLWMENHVFARGRIGRENWQRQARELAASVAG